MKPLRDGLHHVVRFCACSSCRNRRNQKKGRAAQYRTHKALIGSGYSPYHEESGLFADITVRPEVKTGQQIPASFRSFVASKWFKDALSQSERSIPEGVDAKPAVSIDGRFLVVDIRSQVSGLVDPR